MAVQGWLFFALPGGGPHLVREGTEEEEVWRGAGGVVVCPDGTPVPELERESAVKTILEYGRKHNYEAFPDARWALVNRGWDAWESLAFASTAEVHRVATQIADAVERERRAEIEEASRQRWAAHHAGAGSRPDGWFPDPRPKVLSTVENCTNLAGEKCTSFAG